MQLCLRNPQIALQRRSCFSTPPGELILKSKNGSEIITINVPVVFMARYVMVLRSATSLRGALEGVGPENPKKSRPKPLSISAIKTTGTLVVLCTQVLLCTVVCCCLLLCDVVCCVLLCVRGVGRSPCSCVV